MEGLIIVPYRDRKDHLDTFVDHMRKNYHQLDICIVEQSQENLFNRGKLLNIGFIENPDYDYYIFHDVDMIPSGVKYEYPKRPTHLATKVSQFNYTMPYKEYFGGVVVFSKQQFIYVNGYTNKLFGWGLEDDDLRRELHLKHIKIDRKSCVFESLPHEKQTHLSDNYRKNELMMKHGRPKDDGLSHCSYEILKKDILPNYKKISVKL